MRKIEAMFDTDIGIPNANNVETQSKCAMWLEELQESIKATNNMFGLDISVDWRFPDAYEGGVNNVGDCEPVGPKTPE